MNQGLPAMEEGPCRAWTYSQVFIWLACLNLQKWWERTVFVVQPSTNLGPFCFHLSLLLFPSITQTYQKGKLVHFCKSAKCRLGNWYSGFAAKAAAEIAGFHGVQHCRLPFRQRNSLGPTVRSSPVLTNIRVWESKRFSSSVMEAAVKVPASNTAFSSPHHLTN